MKPLQGCQTLANRSRNKQKLPAIAQKLVTLMNSSADRLSGDDINMPNI